MKKSSLFNQQLHGCCVGGGAQLAKLLARPSRRTFNIQGRKRKKLTPLYLLYMYSLFLMSMIFSLYKCEKTGTSGRSLKTILTNEVNPSLDFYFVTRSKISKQKKRFDEITLSKNRVKA